MKEQVYKFKTKIGGWQVIGRGTGDILSGLWIEGQGGYEDRMDEAIEESPFKCFADAENWLSRYAEGKPPCFLPKLHLTGTDFQMVVWQELLKIPYGCTLTYGQLSERVRVILGKDNMSAQAIGGAVSKNPISLIVPCHRVVGKGDKLVGYQGGVEIKKYLLELESNGPR